MKTFLEVLKWLTVIPKIIEVLITATKSIYDYIIQAKERRKNNG